MSNIQSKNNQIYGTQYIGGVLGKAVGTIERMYSIENTIIADDVNADSVGRNCWFRSLWNKHYAGNKL